MELRMNYELTNHENQEMANQGKTMITYQQNMHDGQQLRQLAAQHNVAVVRHIELG